MSHVQPRRWVILLAIALPTLLLHGCGGSGASGPVKRVTQQQTVDRLTIALEAPERPQPLAEQDVVVTLTDSSGKPVDGAQVWLALMMPAHPMSPNEPDATPTGNGHYRAKAIFTMSGTWNLEVHVTVQGQEHIASFHAQTP